MNVVRSAATLLLAWATGFSGHAASGDRAENDFNAWPVVVERGPLANAPALWSAAGPFLFRTPDADGIVSGFRPVWMTRRGFAGELREAHFLFPLFSYATDESVYEWSVFELIRRTGRRADAGPPVSIFEPRDELEIWPFWFSRESGDPEQSYRGMLPVAGTVRNKLGMERFRWIAFPLYAEIERRSAVTTYTPFPFVRITRGAAQGWGLWPLFNTLERPGVSREAYYLWPFGYTLTRFPSPDDPPGTIARRDHGALPFYAYSTGPGITNVSVAWPLFGYTDRTLPTRYHETRYFWPALVQGRGEDKHVNRWAPFYTHSIVKGYDKRWFAWPLLRHAQWEEKGLRRTKTQLLYFLYIAQRQESIARPDLPAATLRHFWPLLSTWQDGAGRSQWQLLSPLEPFFPAHEQVRHAWTPFFALARHDRRGPGEARTSLLWDAITWTERENGTASELHVGPLVSIARGPGRQRVAFGNGLFGFERADAAGGWRIFWLDFRRKSGTTGAPSGQ